MTSHTSKEMSLAEAMWLATAPSKDCSHTAAGIGLLLDKYAPGEKCLWCYIERLQREMRRTADRDELYRQRQQSLSRLQAAAGGYQELGDSLLRVSAERDRLREALERIAECVEYPWAAKIAREALAHEPPCDHDLQSPDKTLKATMAPHYGWRCTVCGSEWYPSALPAEVEDEEPKVPGCHGYEP